MTSLSSGSAAQRLQRPEVGQPQRGGERVGHARVGDVGVRVRDVQGDAGPHQRGHRAALRAGGGHRVHRAQQQRVVGDQQVRAPRDGLVDDGLDRVDGEQHPAYRLVGVAGDQPDGVPVGGPARVVEPVEHADDVGQGDACGHARARTWNGRTQSSRLSSSMVSRHE